MTKPNPLKLNPLQLKTLTLLQHIARLWGEAPADGSEGVEVNHFPHAHGNHFHIGDATVFARDATGLTNASVWTALERRGLVKSSYPYSLILTPDGQAYETGIADAILHRSDH